MFLGVILVVVGLIALLVKLGVLTGSVWNYTWPAILIIIGVFLIVRHRPGSRWGWRNCCPPKDEEKKS
ncbi:MAG: DUF5668 domain-containing protein [Chloroflexota bacterium]